MAAVTEAVVEVMDQAVVEAVTIHPVVVVGMAVVEEVKFIFYYFKLIIYQEVMETVEVEVAMVKIEVNQATGGKKNKTLIIIKFNKMQKRRWWLW